MNPHNLFPLSASSITQSGILFVLFRVFRRAAMKNLPLEWPPLAVEWETGKSARSKFGTLPPDAPRGDGDPRRGEIGRLAKHPPPKWHNLAAQNTRPT